MRVIVIDYDLRVPGQEYEAISQYVKSHSSWAHALKSTWIVCTNKTAAQVRDEIVPKIDDNDRLLVIDITGDAAAWSGLPPEVATWIKNNINGSLRRAA